MIPKFRAWHKEKKIMADVVQINFWQKELSVKLQDVAHFYVWEFSEIELMQWTGLKDKAGNDIYKDDIVKVYNNSFVEFGNYLSEHNLRIVEWVDDYARLGWDMSGLTFCKRNQENFLVIGNIHQNGDLLNV